MESWELSKEVAKAFGDDYIIVYKPPNLDYFITASCLNPAETTEIISELGERMRRSMQSVLAAQEVGLDLTKSLAHHNRAARNQ